MNAPCAGLLAAVALQFLSPVAAQTGATPGDPARQADPGAVPAPEARPAEDLAGFLDGAIAALARDNNVPGVTLAVVQDGQPPIVKGYGVADVGSGRPVDGDETLFRIGSVSKTFTWTAAMMLVDRGRLDLDTDVNDYLETFRIREAFGAPVTMNHLMAHRTGFETTLRVFTVSDDDPRSLAEVLAAHQPERVRPPGTRTSYSNWGAALAAHVVARAAGMPYAEFIEREILEPLGMDSTTLAAPARMPPVLRERLATAHAFERGAHTQGDFMQIGAYAPAGAMASTAADMARWMRFHLNGGALDGVRLMSADAHARMWSRAFDDRPAGTDLAHGFQHAAHRGYETFGHGGSTGLFNSQMILVPELGLGVFASQNSERGGYDLVGRLPELAIDRLVRAFPGVPGPAAPPPGRVAPEEYAGGYLTNRRSFSTMTALFSAAYTLEVEPADDGALIVTAGGETMRYTPLAGSEDVFANRFGQRLVFRRGTDGEVVAVHDDSGVHSHERPGALDSPTLLYAAVALAIVLSITTLLGLWRRWRLVPETTRAGRRSSRLAAAAALVVLGFIALTGAALAALSSVSAAGLVDYPPASVVAVSAAGWVVAAAALAMLASLVPAWRASGWGRVRRAHFTLFALALALLAFALWNWRVFGAPLI